MRTKIEPERNQTLLEDKWLSDNINVYPFLNFSNQCQPGNRQSSIQRVVFSELAMYYRKYDESSVDSCRSYDARASYNKMWFV